MVTVGIICEYNPFHLGHSKQIAWIRQRFGADCAIVCLMSGNFVQRGAPAILDKSLRAQAALTCGADLVLELPVIYALSSAEGFAAGGVKILGQFCDYLCFGSECCDEVALMDTARMLLSPEFPPILKAHLARGLSFPAARQAALEAMGARSAPLTAPNDILAVEYCKAILRQGSLMRPLTMRRLGNYHASLPDAENPSATSLRARMLQGENWQEYTPASARDIFANVQLHTLGAGERAILARLRTMTDEEFQALPYGSEGLWRRLMHASRREATLDAILSAVKSKRYTRSRLDRMVMCAFLGITETDLATDAPYVRILGFNSTGRNLLNTLKGSLSIPLRNAGEASPLPYWQLEQRCGALYGLFACQEPQPPDLEHARRIIYLENK